MPHMCFDKLTATLPPTGILWERGPNLVHEPYLPQVPYWMYRCCPA